MRVGERNGFRVLSWPKDIDVGIPDLWRAFPELVVGRFLVNTSLDSGRYRPTAAELAQGWQVVGDLAHSPKISALEQIPRDQFDEWLVFDQPVQISAFETMVNYCDFLPLDFDWEEKRERFWQQVTNLQPMHVIGENYGTYLVTRDRNLAEKIIGAEPAAGGNDG
jgi:hypothetical protein